MSIQDQNRQDKNRQDRNRQDRYPERQPNRRPNYHHRQPILSRGFTVFLIVLALVSAIFAVYMVMYTHPRMARAGLHPNEYENFQNPSNTIGNTSDYYDVNSSENTGTNDSGVQVTNNPPPNVSGGQVNPDDTEGRIVVNPGGYTGDGTTDNSQTGDSNNYAYDYAYDYDYPAEGAYTPFMLLTTVDNTQLPWYLKLVNRYNFLDYYFYPYLRPIGHGHYFDARAYQSLLAMLASAREEGLQPIVASSFRSVSRQTVLFNNRIQRFINENGYDEDAAFEAARRIVAYPGTSEHNLGLAVDIVAVSYQNLTANFGRTAEGIWLAENSYRYGFVLRYPYHKQHITNIIYEPWHFRYVGRTAAAEMTSRDMVLEEFVSELLAS